MSDIKVCRICLRNGVKVYNYDKFYLKQYYEEIMARKVNEKDGLPNYFCYECAAVLYKFHKFKEKCWVGEKALKEVLWSGAINLSLISQLDRKRINLKSPIDIITVSNKVKTYIVKNKSLSESQVNETTKDEVPEIDKHIVECDSDNSFEVNNLAEINKEMINEKTELILDEKTNIEDDRMFSDGDDTNSRTIDDYDKLDIKEEITIENEGVNFNTIQANKDEVINFNTGQANRGEVINFNTRQANRDDGINFKTGQANRDEVININTGPANRDEGIEFNTGQAQKDERINFNTGQANRDERINFNTGQAQREKIINFNTGQANRDEEVVLSTKHKEIEKKNEIDFTDKKTKKFEVSSKKKNYLDPNHWLKINLTEEEALEEFRAKAQDRKYVSAAFQCSDCYKGFSKEEMLNRHIKLKHSESLGPAQCRFCNVRFKWKCHLTGHITQHYTKYKCLRCELVCPLENTALLHNDYHNGVVIKCIHCEEEFRHQSTYYTHLRTHRSEYVCTLCGASFVSTVGLKQHQRTMHINTVVNPEEGVTHTDTYCERCDIKFETRKAYQTHVSHSAKHTEGVKDLACEIPDPSIPKGERKCYKRHPRRFTSCTFCNRNFSSLAAYMKHHTEEHRDEPLPSTSKKDPHVERHICEICGLSLAPGSVASHLNIHTRKKMFSCGTCGRPFSSKTGLNTHQLTHTHEKSVACTLCDRRFKQSSSMKLHYRTYHLKEPYPKRNRKRKNDDLSKDEGHEHSDDNMTLANSNALKK